MLISISDFYIFPATDSLIYHYYFVCLSYKLQLYRVIDLWMANNFLTNANNTGKNKRKGNHDS